MTRPVNLAIRDILSIDSRIFAGFTIYAALICAIGNEIAADHIRLAHQIPTRDTVFFFATASPAGMRPIPQAILAPAILVLAMFIDEIESMPIRRIRYRSMVQFSAKNFCTIVLLSFGSTGLYLMLEAVQLFAMPVGTTSPEIFSTIFGGDAHFTDTGALLAVIALDVYMQILLVLALFTIAKTLLRFPVAAFALTIVVSAKMLMFGAQTSLMLGTLSFLTTGTFPAGLAIATSTIALSFAVCANIGAQAPERSFAMHTLKVNHASKRIRKHTVLRDVNLKFESGRCYEFRGANGSGKTMLIRIIAGLAKPTEGTIQIDNQTLGKDEEFLPNTGVLIESPSFIEDHSGMHNLELLASIRGTASYNDLRTVMETVGLDADLKTPYRKYSLGTKQRLGIAAAIMEDPEIVLLDEPLNALDREGIAMVKRVIAQLKEKHALIIISNHSNDLLDDIVDVSIDFENGATTVVASEDGSL